jgi:hypothetical protein
MAGPEPIRVAGLREWQRDLRTLGTELPRELRQANRQAAELIVDEARARAMALGGVAAKVAPSLKAQAQSTSASVKGGGSAYPMFGGAEFGAGRDSPRRRRPHERRGHPVRGTTLVGWRQFESWTGNGGDAGRFLYPAIRARQEDVIEFYADVVTRLDQKAHSITTGDT